MDGGLASARPRSLPRRSVLGRHVMALGLAVLRGLQVELADLEVVLLLLLLVRHLRGESIATVADDQLRLGHVRGALRVVVLLVREDLALDASVHLVAADRCVMLRFGVEPDLLAKVCCATTERRLLGCVGRLLGFHVAIQSLLDDPQRLVRTPSNAAQERCDPVEDSLERLASVWLDRRVRELLGIDAELLA